MDASRAKAPTPGPAVPTTQGNGSRAANTDMDAFSTQMAASLRFSFFFPSCLGVCVRVCVCACVCVRACVHVPRPNALCSPKQGQFQNNKKHGFGEYTSGCMCWLFRHGSLHVIAQ